MAAEQTADKQVRQAAATATAQPEPDTRERIVRAALRVIGEGGIEAVSNRRLAKEAGVALGSLTYHFPSQTELLRESLLLYASEEVERLEEIATSLEAGEPSVQQVVEEVARIAGETAIGPEQLAVYELYLQAARDDALREAAQRCFAAYDDVAIAALKALGLPSSPAHARVVVALITGASLRMIGSGERDDEGLLLGLATLAQGAGAGDVKAPATEAQ